MDIRESPLWDEIKQVIDSGDKEVHFKYRAEIITPVETLEVTKLISIDVRRQYADKFSDEIMLHTLIPIGSYQYDVYPHRHDIKLRLYREPLSEVSGESNLDDTIVTRTYRAIVAESQSSTLEGSDRTNVSKEDLNRNGFMDVHLQLIDPAIERLRLKTMGGIYKDDRSDRILQGILSLMSADDTLNDDDAILGVDVVPGDNLAIRSHYVIPHGVRVVDLPRYIQDEQGGVYKTGIGSYIQNRIWYIYPEYAVDRFSQTSKNLTVVNVPPKRMPGIERSYFTDGDRVVVIATGETQHVDQTDAMQLNLGNGIRFAHAHKILDGFYDVESNRARSSREDNVFEVSFKPRKNALEVAPISPDRISGNGYRQISSLAPRQGSYLIVEWINANPDLVYPGMPVKYIFATNDGFDEVYGCVLGFSHTHEMREHGMVSGRYVTSGKLMIFISSDDFESS